MSEFEELFNEYMYYAWIVDGKQTKIQNQQIQQSVEKEKGITKAARSRNEQEKEEEKNIKRESHMVIVAEVKHRQQYMRFYKEELERTMISINYKDMLPLRGVSYSHPNHITYFFKTAQHFIIGLITSKHFQKRRADYFLTSVAKEIKKVEDKQMNNIQNQLEMCFKEANDPLKDPINLARRETKNLFERITSSIGELFSRGEQMNKLKDTTEAISQESYQSRRKSKRLKDTTGRNIILQFIVAGCCICGMLALVAIVAAIRFGPQLIGKQKTQNPVTSSTAIRLNTMEETMDVPVLTKDQLQQWYNDGILNYIPTTLDEEVYEYE